jgi:hypothetical protein
MIGRKAARYTAGAGQNEQKKKGREEPKPLKLFKKIK